MDHSVLGIRERAMAKRGTPSVGDSTERSAVMAPTVGLNINVMDVVRMITGSLIALLNKLVQLRRIN